MGAAFYFSRIFRREKHTRGWNRDGSNDDDDDDNDDDADDDDLLPGLGLYL